MTELSRRNFIKASAALGTFTILPSGLWANSPNSKLVFVGCGASGMGGSDIGKINRHKKTQLIAVCDVDKNRMAQWKNVDKFQNYQEMFTKLGDKFDAVCIGTPDHSHSPITLAAMAMGKHVYTQKPLTSKLSQARELQLAAKKFNVVTQMGIQLHSTIGYKITRHFLKTGTIGKIKKVYVWSNKKWGADGTTPPGEIAVPGNLDYELWLAGVSKRPYRKDYHPGGWRKFFDFGCGTLGDMGVHIFDTPFTALELGAPNWVKTTCRESNGFGHPTSNVVELGFTPTKYTTDDFEWVWHDGGAVAGMKIPEIPWSQKVKRPSQGAVYVGENGAILHPHQAGPKFFPDELKKGLKVPKFGRDDHYSQWVEACMDRSKKTLVPFELAAPFTEAVLLGNIAGRFPKQTLKWDTKNLRFTNNDDANKLV